MPFGRDRRETGAAEDSFSGGFEMPPVWLAN
jgi:hypothetical protein